MNQLHRFLFANFGHCGRCMRISFRVAAFTWMTFIVMTMLPLPMLAKDYTFILAVALTGIWLVHITVFSLKRLGEWSDDNAKGANTIDSGRRSALSRFAYTIAAVAVGTALPVRAYPACPDNNYASSRKGYGSCGQFCQTSKNERFPCPKDTRPVYLNNGDCTCCPFSECS